MRHLRCLIFLLLFTLIVGLPGIASAQEGMQYTITVSTSGNGTVSPNGTLSVKSGASVQFSATPNSGYVDEWVVDGNVVQLGGLSYALNGITSNHTVKVIFGVPMVVTTTADTPSLGSLRHAIMWINANPGYNISFSVTGTIALSSSLPVIRTGMAIEGPGPSALAIDGAGRSRPFHINCPGSTVTISELTVQNGSDAVDNIGGGGIRNSGGTVNVNDCIVQRCFSQGGGGVANVGVITLTNCTLQKNSTNFIGGGFANGAGTAILTNCNLSNNAAGSGGGDAGGGMYNNATAMLTNCTLSGNRVGGGAATAGGGGGIYNRLPA